jgi:hypothetical protein
VVYKLESGDCGQERTTIDQVDCLKDEMHAADQNQKLPATVSVEYPQIAAENMAEGARFENTPGPETIARDMFSSVELQAIADELEGGETPIKHDKTR